MYKHTEAMTLLTVCTRCRVLVVNGEKGEEKERLTTEKRKNLPDDDPGPRYMTLSLFRVGVIWLLHVASHSWNRPQGWLREVAGNAGPPESTVSGSIARLTECCCVENWKQKILGLILKFLSWHSWYLAEKRLRFMPGF